ncbi:MAG: TraR/DksA C4-type zinc finger protein [Candidatus Subteraquimicrobiales bacterium]|nr:TraR/DksA C4-type zinc finger protein [Candidatus Subteraquimicrobiales bacterium]
MDKQKLDYFKKRLLEEKSLLEKELFEIEEGNLHISQSTLTGNNPYQDHFADMGTATFERERDLSLEINARDILERVKIALQRIEKGIYDLCSVCGSDIDPERLEILPYADSCIECKRKEEKER